MILPKVLQAKDVSPEEIVEMVQDDDLIVVHGGRLEVRDKLKQAEVLSSSESGLKEARYRITYNHIDTELGYPHTSKYFTQFAENLAIAAYKRSSLKELHSESELPDKLIDDDQAKALSGLVTEIAELENVEGLGSDAKIWDIWDSVSDLCDAIKVKDKPRYRSIAFEDFEKAKSFALSWLVQLLKKQVKLQSSNHD